MRGGEKGRAKGVLFINLLSFSKPSDAIRNSMSKQNVCPKQKNILFFSLCSRKIRIEKSGETRDIFASNFMRECNLFDNKTPPNVEPRTTSNFFPKHKMITVSERFGGVRRTKRTEGDISREGQSECEDEGENKTKLT